jgi:DNA replication and repair protein RecF
MGFERLRFFNFRNLQDRELSLGARQVFLVGENGQGKTNLLEALHLLCIGSSFREKRESALVRDPNTPLSLHGILGNAATGTSTLALHVAPGRRKEMRLNDKPVTERRSLLSEVLCIAFVQQDMEFVVGTPEDRRRFFDQTLILSDLSFIDSLRGYRQVLRSRNLSLKDHRDNLLDVYDAQLASLGLSLQMRRADLVHRFDAVFDPLFREITGCDQPVRIRYRPSWDRLHTTDEVMAHLASHRARDRLVATTTSGPHRDACTYVQDGKEFSHYASTGQLRLCALALRVAQARFLAETTGRKPILLLDDVLLELDPARKRAFLSRLPAYDQAIFTFLPDETWQSYRTPDTQVLTVVEGDFAP